MKAYTGPPMALGDAAAAGARLVVPKNTAAKGHYLGPCAAKGRLSSPGR